MENIYKARENELPYPLNQSSFSLKVDDNTSSEWKGEKFGSLMVQQAASLSGSLHSFIKEPGTPPWPWRQAISGTDRHLPQDFLGACTFLEEANNEQVNKHVRKSTSAAAQDSLIKVSDESGTFVFSLCQPWNQSFLQGSFDV